VTEAAAILRAQWAQSAARLERRCEGLTDDEFCWQPAPSSWTVKPDPDAPSGWTYDYEWPAPTPAPVTTIGWRLVHIAADNWIYWEHAFGPGQRNFPDLAVPSTAASAMQNWRDSRRAITDWLDAASGQDLAEMRPSHLGSPKSAATVLMILIDEQTHHGAEIALLRDLYLRRTSATMSR